MNWRAYALRFGFQLSLRTLLRTRRRATEKVVGLTLMAPLLVWAVAAIQLTWCLTGRARRIRHFLGFDQIVVLPFGRKDPAKLRREIDELVASARAEVGP